MQKDSEQLPSDPVSTTDIVMEVGCIDKSTNPQHVRCADCGHVWIGLYLPQPISTAAKIMKNLCCPMCGAGAKRIMVHL